MHTVYKVYFLVNIEVNGICLDSWQETGVYTNRKVAYDRTIRIERLGYRAKVEPVRVTYKEYDKIKGYEL